MNDVSIFKYESKEVRTVDVEGETFWLAKKSVMEFAGKIITMQEDVKNKKALGEKLFNSRKFSITVSSPNKEEQ